MKNYIPINIIHEASNSIKNFKISKNNSIIALDEIDNIIVMTVVPGLPGQTLIPETVDTLNTLRKIIKDRNLNITLEVDGGINLDNVKKVKNADIIVSGSCITKSDNFQDTITKLRK